VTGGDLPDLAERIGIQKQTAQRGARDYADQYWVSQTVQAALRPSACSS